MNRKAILALVSLNVVTLLLAASMMAISLSARAAPESPAAGVPSVVSYQGYLTDQYGAPMNGSVNLLFGIYTAEAQLPGDVPVWVEGPRAIAVAYGYFNVLLGEDEPLTADVFDAPDRWLQISIVDGSTQTHLPRQRIASAPFALHAQQAASAPWSGLTGVPAGLWDGDDDDIPLVQGCKVVATDSQAIQPAYNLTTLIFGQLVEGRSDCWSLSQPTRLYARANGYTWPEPGYPSTIVC